MASLTIVEGVPWTASHQADLLQSLKRAGYRVLDGSRRNPTWFLGTILRSAREDLVLHGSWIGQGYIPPLRRMLERVALSHRAVAVLCVPLAGDLKTLDHHTQHRALTDYPTDLPVVPWHPFFEPDLTLLLEELNRARAPANEGPGIGRWGAKTLLIGERGKGRVLPFVHLKNRGCSWWLAERLEDWQISEASLYWINAQKASGLPTDPEILRSGFEQVIALGKSAVRWCLDQQQPYLEVSHPQAWKRFHHHQEYPLKRLLSSGRPAIQRLPVQISKILS